MRHRGLNIHTVSYRRPPRPTTLGVGTDFYQPFPAAHVPKLRAAIDIMITKSTSKECELVFRASGHGKTIAELLSPGNIWLNYTPLKDGDAFFEGAPSPAAVAEESISEITIFEQGMVYSSLILASVLTHELDHLNGVRGDFVNKDNTYDRYSHGMADHAALNCTGVITPRTTIIHELDRYGVKCGSCTTGMDLLMRRLKANN